MLASKTVESGVNPLVGSTRHSKEDSDAVLGELVFDKNNVMGFRIDMPIFETLNAGAKHRLKLIHMFADVEQHELDCSGLALLIHRGANQKRMLLRVPKNRGIMGTPVAGGINSNNTGQQAVILRRADSVTDFMQHQPSRFVSNSNELTQRNCSGAALGT